MTNKEAIERIIDHMLVHRIGEYPHIYIAEALNMAIYSLKEIDNVKKERDKYKQRFEELKDKIQCGWFTDLEYYFDKWEDEDAEN